MPPDRSRRIARWRALCDAVAGGCLVLLVSLPCPTAVRAGDAFVELERLRSARAAATSPTVQETLRLQEALLSSLIGLPELAERLARKATSPELVFLRALLRGTPSSPPLAPGVDASTRERVAEWLRRRGACTKDEAKQAPLLCGGVH